MTTFIGGARARRYRQHIGTLMALICAKVWATSDDDMIDEFVDWDH